MTKYIEVAQHLVRQHPFLIAAALAVILLILLIWVAEREASQYITRIPGEDK